MDNSTIFDLQHILADLQAPMKSISNIYCYKAVSLRCNLDWALGRSAGPARY